MSLTISKETAKRLYSDGPDWIKPELIKEFGEDQLKKQSFEEIKTFEDACKALSIDPDAVCSDSDTPDEAAYKMLKVVIAALNQGWTPDWNNTDQRKWWPYFNLSSGFGFSSALYYFDITTSNVGSRLCFESQEKAIYAGEQFTDLYKAFLT